MDGATTIEQSLPLPLAVDEYPAIGQDSIQQKRGVRLDPLQAGHVDPATGAAFQALGQLGDLRWAAVGKRHQQVEIRPLVLLTARDRSVEHGESDEALGP
jgi:hypothetical protein